MEPMKMQQPTWTYRASLERVVDGDTVDLRVALWPMQELENEHSENGGNLLDLGFGIHVKSFSSGDMTPQRVRLAGIDTYEMRGDEKEKGQQAKFYTVAWFAKQHNQCLVKTVKWKGKYGRYIGHIFNPDGESLNQLLLDEGHAEEVDW